MDLTAPCEGRIEGRSHGVIDIRPVADREVAEDHPLIDGAEILRGSGAGDVGAIDKHRMDRPEVRPYLLESRFEACVHLLGRIEHCRVRELEGHGHSCSVDGRSFWWVARR